MVYKTYFSPFKNFTHNFTHDLTRTVGQRFVYTRVTCSLNDFLKGLEFSETDFYVMYCVPPLPADYNCISKNYVLGQVVATRIKVPSFPIPALFVLEPGKPVLKPIKT